jgi:cytosine/uracil/thiamine/allantoin permease
MVAAGLSFQAALAAGFFGTIVALVFYLIMATLGVDYGIPGQVATRAVYGLRGAKLIPSLLRTLVSVYWFAFQTLVGASAIVAVLAKITGVTYPLIGVLCHEHRPSIRRCATVREMKEGPSRSAIMG